MAFSRKFLKEILAGREDAAELIDQIIEAHIEAVAPLKAELNRLQDKTAAGPQTKSMKSMSGLMMNWSGQWRTERTK